ncbi:hypothetical protein HB943_01430 [Listeria weihenstephanensis]|uniref:Uncharacterized protein n=1 Tax=Listeria weihenstephanensis TaxID=1006155 RepID=A0A841Z213_9LIST|nr:hypothetical protein [Listeria weihenstephanensis]
MPFPLTVDKYPVWTLENLIFKIKLKSCKYCYEFVYYYEAVFKIGLKKVARIRLLP